MSELVVTFPENNSIQISKVFHIKFVSNKTLPYALWWHQQSSAHNLGLVKVKFGLSSLDTTLA